MALLGNLFAIFAMGTGFFGFGVALKQTFVWDHKLSPWFSQFLVISIPLALFLLGLRSFIGILDLVGGLFIGVEAIIVALVFGAPVSAAIWTPRVILYLMFGSCSLRFCWSLHWLRFLV